MHDAGNGCGALDRELERWLDPSVPPDDLDSLALALLVADEVRAVGKHFLPTNALERLSVVRERHGARDRRLDAFLDCILDKHEGRFWNRTYLSLPLLEVLRAEHDLPPSRLAALLAADLIRHELSAAAREDSDVSPLGRPDPRTLRTRVRHATRFMTAHLDRTLSAEVLPTMAQEGGPDLAELLEQLPASPGPNAGEWLRLTAQPVSTVHDEYFFLRVLQAHELAFTAMNRPMREAISATRDRRLGLAASLLEEVVVLMDRNASLFRIIATMRPEAFHTFRELTDGASAIQSEQYKRFEGLCGLPPASRLRSPAFDAVPAVRAELRDGPDTMTDAYRDAVTSSRQPAELETLAGLLGRLEDSHRRWKGTHLTLASRMLGNARGSGNTSGVDYLRSWVDHRLFWQLPELAATQVPRSA